MDEKFYRQKNTMGFYNISPLEYRQEILTEYSALRDEIIKRIEIRHQLLTFTLIIASTIISFGAKEGITILLLIYPLIAFLLALSWMYYDVQTGLIGIYIKNYIEKKSIGLGWEHFIQNIKYNKPSTLFSKVSPFFASGIFVITQALALTLAFPKISFSSIDGNCFFFVIDLSISCLTFILLISRLRYIKNYNPNAVIFDMDGIIVQSENLKARAHANTIKELGGVADSDYYYEVMGQSFEKVRDKFINKFLNNSRSNIDLSNYREVFNNNYEMLIKDEIKVTDGIEDFIKILIKKSFSIAVVSSSSSIIMVNILRKTNLYKYFKVIVSADNVFHEKPAPDPYILAFKLLNKPPEACVVIEDTETGIEAAINAGAKVFAVRHLYNKNQNFSKANGIIDSFDDISLLIQKLNRLLAVSINFYKV